MVPLNGSRRPFRLAVAREMKWGRFNQAETVLRSMAMVRAIWWGFNPWR